MDLLKQIILIAAVALCTAMVSSAGFIIRLPSGGGSFTYYSSSFTPSAYLTNTAIHGSAADGKQGLISFWSKTSTTGTRYFLYGGTAKFIVHQVTGDDLVVRIKDSSGTDVVHMIATDGSPINQWQHIMASWDTSTAGRRWIAINGVDSTDTVTTFTLDGVCDYTHTSWYIGGSSLTALLSEYYFTNEWMDQTSAIAAFYDAGSPKDLGSDGSTPTGTQPWVYLNNEYSTIQTNSGSGGNWSETGTIGDGGADKP